VNSTSQELTFSELHGLNIEVIYISTEVHRQSAVCMSASHNLFTQ